MAEQRRGLVRLAVLQELRAAHGIKVKSGSCRAAAAGKQHPTAVGEGKVFGISLHVLPQSLVPEYGTIPNFLLDACKHLEEHIHTEGLFRKSGALVRLKTLKSKLDQGENCLSAALPCDIAGLLKQFFRELPEPILPSHLQEALLKAQQLGEEKKTVTMLLSCLFPDKTIDTLRYFFNFLRNVSLRSNENKMDSSNLAVIFAPNLLHSSNDEKMSVSTEKKLRLQASVVQTLIDHAGDIGQVPEFILEKVPAMLGIDGLGSTPSLKGYEESESPGEWKRKRRQSVGDIVSGALNKLKSNRTPSTTPQRDRSVFPSVTPVILTPSTKRKLLNDSSQGFSSKKRRSLKHSFGFELLPSSLFNSGSTPALVQYEASPCVSRSSHTSLSPSVSSEKHLSSTGNRRSKRNACKKICRAESGKTGCFSPKISRKEMVRRSLRLKFSLGKSNKDVVNVASGCPAVRRSENIGWRLANQQDMENRVEDSKSELLFASGVSEKFTKKGSKNISKSEENLLTPKCHDKVSYRMSWNGPSNADSQGTSNSETNLMGYPEAETCSSEPVLVIGKPPVIPDDLRSTIVNKQDVSLREFSLCEDENLTAETLLKIKKAFSDSGSNLHNLIADTKSSLLELTEERLNETPHLTGLSPVKEQLAEVSKNLAVEELKDKFESSTTGCHQLRPVVENCFHNSVEIELQTQKLETENVPELTVSQVMTSEGKLNFQGSLSKDKLHSLGRKGGGVELEQSQIFEGYELKYCNSERESVKSIAGVQIPASQLLGSRNKTGKHGEQTRSYDKTTPKTLPASDLGRVSDHIQWFNKLCLNDPCSASKAKPPLKFQRTPVRQSVRRMNSLLEASSQSINCKLAKPSDAYSPLAKSVSYDSALSSCLEESSKNSTTSSSSCETVHQVLMSYKEMDLIPKSHSKPLNPVEKDGVSVRTVRSCKQKVTVLEDLTNQEVSKAAVKLSINTNIIGAIPDKNILTKSATGKARYRGSPKNPISKAKLLPSTKPVDL
ncbi:PREDICTED: rho GTPase-activating protein 11A isoform X1 [Gavialis gangeticus]|uniref:rho GTPase-activating protein 11A isoform X1 n=1 Tax=Gavialis gangeticus TaxID=94835 RepID=UPI00092EBB5B|nr:PREDICTED: rho GTPase-activating protein 11A isoform X1 [Gavialis gangeticus]